MRTVIKRGLERVVRTLIRLRKDRAPTSAHILTYHEVLGDGETLDNPFNQVTARSLAGHVRRLQEAGLEPVTVAELWRALQEDAAGAVHKVALTFDDGLQEHAALVLPVLRKLEARATFYLVSGPYAGATLGTRMGRGHLSPDQARELHDAGMEIGSHSRTHPVLAQLGAEALRREIAGSRQELQQLTGAPVDSFAYPYGSRRTYSEAAVAAVEEAGYANAVCTSIGGNGAAAQRFQLLRVPVYATDDDDVLIRKAVGGMDWAGRMQELWLSAFPHRSTRARKGKTA